MCFIDRYPIIVTTKLNDCAALYEAHLGFAVAFRSSWIVALAAGGGSATLAFMSPDHSSAPPGPEIYSGTGLCFKLQVEDAKAGHAEFTARGFPATYPLTDEPFSQRRFGFADPFGLWVNVVEQIEPAEGFWDKYMV